jgi:hypothetical protein
MRERTTPRYYIACSDTSKWTHLNRPNPRTVKAFKSEIDNELMIDAHIWRWRVTQERLFIVSLEYLLQTWVHALEKKKFTHSPEIWIITLTIWANGLHSPSIHVAKAIKYGFILFQHTNAHITHVENVLQTVCGALMRRQGYMLSTYPKDYEPSSKPTFGVIIYWIDDGWRNCILKWLFLLRYNVDIMASRAAFM